ncbi:MAG: nickel pincer cofactor biosynthesis protein LarB [Lachnospiraceae bacterium]|nr:nickel pincer cofactor biosynthesis protein LarB [Lachnospiraceae bacterium]
MKDRDELYESIQKGESSVDIGYANIDLSREKRSGAPEVIYGAGKTAAQIIGILHAMRQNGIESVLATRVDAEKAALIKNEFHHDFIYHEDAAIGILGTVKKPDGVGKIAVLAAGTSDLKVAEEAALTAEYLGNEVLRLYDVGVAGLHRLLARKDELLQARVVIAVAGMEGALASVVGGLVSVPVIAVPTSVGYGASFGGISALLAMLNSCASGVSVVNIDNGFGAAYQASLINHL